VHAVPKVEGIQPFLFLCVCLPLLKVSLKVLPCCQLYCCEDCVWSTGCPICHTSYENYKTLTEYNPTNSLLSQCLSDCRHCGRKCNHLLHKDHELNCLEQPISQLVLDLSDDLKEYRGKPKVTLNDLRTKAIQTNLRNCFTSLQLSVDNVLNYQTHVVTEQDTLPGIALRYNCTVDKIRQLNHMGCNVQIHGYTVLRVPVTNGSSSPGLTDSMYDVLKRRMLAKFVRDTGLNADEAWLYLESSDFDYEKAILEYQEGAAWEKAALRKQLLSQTDSTPVTYHDNYYSVNGSTPDIIKSRRCCFAL